MLPELHSETVLRRSPERLKWRLVLKCKTKKQLRNQNMHKMAPESLSDVFQVTSSPEAPN